MKNKYSNDGKRRKEKKRIKNRPFSKKNNLSHMIELFQNDLLKARGVKSKNKRN